MIVTPTTTDTVVVLTPGGTGQVVSAAWTLAVFLVGYALRWVSARQRRV